MDTRAALLTAALKVLEDEGKAQFSTRAVSALANVAARSTITTVVLMGY